MIDQNLKEHSPDRQTSDYNILPLFIYSIHDHTNTFLVPYHWHDEMEFIYVEEGELLIHTNGHEQHAKKGEVYFLNSQEIHQICSVTPHSIHHAIIFDPKIIRFEWYDPCQQKYINPLIKGKIKYLFHANDHPTAKELIVRDFKDALAAYREQHNSWPITVKASLLKIIATLSSHDLLIHASTPQKSDNEKAMIAKMIMTYIQENHTERLTLDQLANVVNLSPQYFCKFFKATFGKTAVEYINEYRIEKACQFLKQTNDKIIDIAFSVGFDNASYFIRTFKTLKSMTPSDYRRSITSGKE